MRFNKEEFAKILESAKGSDKQRSMNKYAEECDVSVTYISKLLRCLVDTAPSPDIIRKFSSHAYNGVNYNDFMRAAGHIDDNIFISQNMYLIKGNLTWEELSSKLLTEYTDPVFKSKFSPQVLEKIALGDIVLDDFYIVDLLAMYVGVSPDVFFRYNTIEDFEKSKEIYKMNQSKKENKFVHLHDWPEELIDFIKNPKNRRYFDFAYSLSKKGIDPSDITHYTLKS